MTDNYKNLRIVFMGTPEFAVASLHALVMAGCNIVGVITAPDKQAGRGLQLQESAVKKYAVENNLKVLQPLRLKNPEFIATLKDLNADIQIVVAFRMLPEVVWNMPPMGTINVHGSLLPQYRGAAPINWAIINGEQHTGVTTFKLQHEIDTGNILLSEKIEVKENDNAGIVHDKLKEVGAALLIKTIKLLANNELTEVPQENSVGEIKHAPKLFTEIGNINWTKSLQEIYNLVRGLSPYPAAYSFLNGKKLKIFSAERLLQHPDTLPGTLRTDGKTFLHFACNDGYLNIITLQLEGKKKMAIKEFLRGYRFVQ